MLIFLAPTVWSTCLVLIIAIAGKRALMRWFPRNPDGIVRPHS
jgi:hypothetical protein